MFPVASGQRECHCVFALSLFQYIWATTTKILSHANTWQLCFLANNLLAAADVNIPTGSSYRRPRGSVHLLFIMWTVLLTADVLTWKAWSVGFPNCFRDKEDDHRHLPEPPPARCTRERIIDAGLRRHCPESHAICRLQP